MADALLGSTVEVLVEKAISLASQQIGLFLGFKKDLEKLRNSLTMIQDVLHDAERDQVTRDAVKRWLKKLECVAFDADNLLDDFNYELIRRKVEIQNQLKRKICFFFSLSNPIAFRFKMANKIQKINEDLKRINEEANDFGLQSQTGARDAPALAPSQGFIKLRETDSVTVDSSFVGRDGDISAIITKLIAESNNEAISVLPIMGMGGIGKTTLARNVFNDPKIDKHFDKRIWVCVSDDFDENRLFGLILEQLQGRKPEIESKEARLNKLKELLKGKKYLLVLDDVWNKEPALWINFLGSLKGTNPSNGNCILLTTREKKVANIMGTFSPCCLKKLLDDQCWLILKKNAFGDRDMPDDDELKDIGFRIAQKCDGLPLAASVLGGMLHNKEKEEWRSTLEIELQNSGTEENIVTKILKLSFDRLPSPSLKKCFAYCSIFPKDFEIKKNQLIQLWAAEGFLHSNPGNKQEMEELGEMFFTILLDSNLFQEAVKDEYGNVLNCKMHDLVHDLVLSISESKTLRLNETRRVDDQRETFPFRFLVMERSAEEEIPPSPLKESFRYITTLEFLKGKINDSLISSFTCLRVLNLASTNVRELPKSIGKLSHLRYLDSSDTLITFLPDSICKLYHLQTLRARDCRSLKNFPNNFKNLVNLRHFDFFTEDSSSNLVPIEIGQLKCLQILPFFNIGVEKGRLLRELRNLENLSGCLEIRNIELVKNKNEAESANLVGKSNICELRLLWGESNEMRGNESQENQVLEGLEPHPNLKGLVIQNFLGDQLSQWLEKLENLVRLELVNCENCREIPALDRVGSLQVLEIKCCPMLKSISIPGGHHLGVLDIAFCNALTKLSIPEIVGAASESESSSSSTFTTCPSLQRVLVYKCPNLISFPVDLNRTPSLSTVWLFKCNKLTDLPKGELCSLTSLRQLWIGPFSNTTDLHSFLHLFNALHPQHLPLLEDLWLCGWPHWECLPHQLQHLSALQRLRIDGFGVKSLPDWFGKLSSLEILRLYNCENLENLPSHQSMTSLTELRELWIDGCPLLKERCNPESPNSEWSKISHIPEITIDGQQIRS